MCLFVIILFIVESEKEEAKEPEKEKEKPPQSPGEIHDDNKDTGDIRVS